ncbi:MAG: histidine phosphatase family protein [Lacipirellulaceae bacterium]
MQTVLLVRAGATDFDLQGRIQGTLDVPLCAEGVRQAEAAATGVAALAPTALYTSPAKAALQTAEILAQRLDLKVKKLLKLQNLDQGLWQGLLVEEVRTKQPKVYRQWQEQPETVCPPQGESVLAAKGRVAESLAKAFRKHKGGPLVLVAPEPLASLVRHVLQRDELHDLWKPSETCGAWETIEVPDDVFSTPS